MIELSVAAVITMSISGVSYAALNPHRVEAASRAVADRATCRTVDSAIVAYVAERGEVPESVAQLRGYVKGDISRYRIAGGMAAGPGC